MLLPKHEKDDNMFEFIKCSIIRIVWRARNRSNETSINMPCKISDISVGKNSYGSLNVKQYNHGKLRIGNYVSIADNVIFLVGGEHDYHRISTWPFATKIYNLDSKDEKCDILVDDDVWIGYGCIILGGVTIGKGSVIGAGSIVAHNVEPYSVYIGNKTVKKRFSDDIIDKMMNVDFSRISHYPEDMYSYYVKTEVTEDNVDSILKAFEQK